MAVYLLIRPLSRAPPTIGQEHVRERLSHRRNYHCRQQGDVYRSRKHFPLASPLNLAFSQESQIPAQRDPAALQPRNTGSFTAFASCGSFLQFLSGKDDSLAAFLAPASPRAATMLRLMECLPGWALRVQRVTQFA